MSALDHDKPGPAGLFFRVDRLSSSGWHQEHLARQSLERWCSQCGQSACYGFGVSLKDDGVWACGHAACRAAAEAESDTRKRPAPVGDLFGRAA